jgi:hypothetical protein
MSANELPRAEVLFDSDGRKKRPEFIPRLAADAVAELAQRLAASTAAHVVPDGETSSGDQKYRLLTPEEVVERAVAIAELTFQRLIEQGYALTLPPYSEWPNDLNAVGFK